MLALCWGREALRLPPGTGKRPISSFRALPAPFGSRKGPLAKRPALRARAPRNRDFLRNARQPLTVKRPSALSAFPELLAAFPELPAPVRSVAADFRKRRGARSDRTTDRGCLRRRRRGRPRALLGTLAPPRRHHDAVEGGRDAERDPRVGNEDRPADVQEIHANSGKADRAPASESWMTSWPFLSALH
jgi:hypothetical protein